MKEMKTITSAQKSKEKLANFFLSNGAKTVYSSVICAVLGILIGFIVLLAIKPQNAGIGLVSILQGFVSSVGYNPSQEKIMSAFGDMVIYIAPLLMCGLSVLFCYKAGLFNIGVAGQYCMGIGVSLYAALAWNCPWYVCVLLAMLACAVWAALVGVLKAYCGVNEVISGIMLNWIGLYIVRIMLNRDGIKNGTYAKLPSGNSLMPSWGLDKLFGGNKYVTIGIIIAIIIAIVIQVVLSKTTFGYELKATGNNKNAAKYAGMKEKVNVIITLAIGGALAGLGASFFYLTGRSAYGYTANALPAMGFNGIAVAFLGGLNPIGTIFAAFFIQYVTEGGRCLLNLGYPTQVSDLIVAIIIYLCAFSLFIKYLMSKRPDAHKKGKKAKTEVQPTQPAQPEQNNATEVAE